MKKLTLLVTLFLCTLSYSQGEKTIDWQNLDKINEVKHLLSPVKNKTFTVFKIKNINKFLYKVEIAGKNFDLQTPVPTELQTLFRLSSEQLETKVETKATSDAIKKTEDQITKIEEVQNTPGNPAALNAKLDEMIATCNDYKKILEDIKDFEFDLKLKQNKLINIAKLDIDYSSMQDKLQEIDSPVDPADILKSLRDKYEAIEALYKEAVKLSTNVAQKQNIEKASDSIDDAFETIRDEKIITLYESVDYLYKELGLEQNFTAQAPPVQMNGDFVEYKCKVTPSKVNTLGAYKSPIQFDFILPNYGGIKADFSVGPTISFGKNSKDEKFYLEESTTTGKSYLRERNNNNAGTPGLAAMMHVYDRVATETAIGGLFGVGAGFQTIDDVDLSFYLGASVILGMKQKVMINAGLSFLRVDRLKDKEFEVGKEYTTQDFDLNNVVEKVFKSSFFISLSYNLAKRVDN
ncbi:hypothetical protein [Flavobacterium sp.]|uniref:hypothetical protein n=1 Tax=Flavobacterium sp. TaxID=239 RepID=UPI00286B1A79|nr:hypothetical protein [Flavobacterium sp.]